MSECKCACNRVNWCPVRDFVQNQVVTSSESTRTPNKGINK